ncbi:MAG: hypothetical protein MHMPM18_003809 [Marteilia pararefringens]
MDNQPTSGRNELECDETGVPYILRDGWIRRRNDLAKQQNIVAKVVDYGFLNAGSLLLSFLIQGMSLSAAVVNLHRKNKFDALSITPLILSSLMIALQFFSTLFLRCRFEINRILSRVIAVFAILIQIAIIVLAGINSHESVLVPSLSSSISNFIVVSYWSWTFYKLSVQCENYINFVGKGFFETTYLTISVFYLIVWKQAFIGFLTVLLQLQNPFSLDYCNVLYNMFILIHLIFEDPLIMRIVVLKSRFWHDFSHNYQIAIKTLNLITFSVFIIFSYVGRSKLSSLQLAIWLILIAIFILEFSNFIIRKKWICFSLNIFII